MDTWILVGVIVALFVILSIGGGVGYFFWIASRPKKMTWKARVYQLGEGKLPRENTEQGYDLNDLKPYATDIIEKVDKKSGATHYWLQRMKKAVPVVTADCVEVWGDKEKWVRVLLQGDTTTLLKAGYDYKTGQQIFKPMPHDRINMIKTEVDERKARIEDTKDILAQITPFVVVGIAMLGLVAIVYFQVQGAIKSAELYTQSSEKFLNQLNSFRTTILDATGCVIGDDKDRVTIEEPPTIPP